MDLERPGVVVVRSGIGPEAAAAAVDEVLADDVGSLVSAGYCGALSAGLPVGALVAAERVVHENTGESFAADEVLLAAAPGRRGVLVSVSEVARNPADRVALAGLAVDMESATLARAAARADVPFLALRAVSDGLHDRIPDLTGLVDRFGTPERGALIRHLLARPGDLRSLLRLRRGGRAADAALREGVSTLLERLGR